jgi:hypothetical protein
LWDALVASFGWQLPHVAGRVIGPTSCGRWQLVQARPSACAPAPRDAFSAWHDAHGAAVVVVSPACGAWQPRQSVRPPCDVFTSAWHVAHIADGGAPPCGAWQLVHVACSATRDATRVGFAPWHPVHGFASRAAVCGAWQSAHPSDPACCACSVARSAWHATHSFFTGGPSGCARWHAPHAAFSVACTRIAPASPCACAWHPRHAGGFASVRNEWHAKQSFTAPSPA